MTKPLKVTTLTKGLELGLVEAVEKGLNGGRFSYSYAGRAVGGAIDTRPRDGDATLAGKTYKSASTNIFTGNINYIVHHILLRNNST